MVVEINASHASRDVDPDRCPYCRLGMGAHCPERMTLGIDRLPGGFSPFFLAPLRAIHPVPSEVGLLAAVFAEPLAAAFRAVSVSPPRAGDRVAVLGPRRLGMLLIALHVHRRRTGGDFEIVGVIRHGALAGLCLEMGADRVMDLKAQPDGSKGHLFDTVFDTTGSPEGFETALRFARRTLHLKSTHGRPAPGLKCLTEMVVDEIALLPFREDNLYSATADQSHRAPWAIFLSPRVSREVRQRCARALPRAELYSMEPASALKTIRQWERDTARPGLPRFDLAVVEDLGEVDEVLRASRAESVSLVRPGGAILLAGGGATQAHSFLAETVRARGVGIQTSRCGNLAESLSVLKGHPALRATLEQKMITRIDPLDQISTAFRIASEDTHGIKGIVRIGQRTMPPS